MDLESFPRSWRAERCAGCAEGCGSGQGSGFPSLLLLAFLVCYWTGWKGLTLFSQHGFGPRLELEGRSGQWVKRQNTILLTNSPKMLVMDKTREDGEWSKKRWEIFWYFFSLFCVAALFPLNRWSLNATARVQQPTSNSSCYYSAAKQ